MRFVPFFLLSMFTISTQAADWSQYMQNAAHTGYAPGETIQANFSLLAQIEVSDAILTSPIVLNDFVFVIDQMGNAYCINPNDSSIVWSTNPEGEQSLGGNTSTPCIIDDRLFYGTTTGNLHILDINTGDIIKSIHLGWSIISAITAQNDNIYFSTVDSTVHSYDINGNQRWKYDHYNLAEWAKQPYDPEADGDKYETPHFGGAPVSIVDNKIVCPVGFDLVCLEEDGDLYKKIWSVRAPVHSVDVPLGVSIEGDYVYCAWPKSDGQGSVVRHKLSDGSSERRTDVIWEQWAVLSPPAVRNGEIYFNRQTFGLSAYQFSEDASPQEIWKTFLPRTDQLNPAIAAAAVTDDQVLFTTLNGELMGVNLTPKSIEGDTHALTHNYNSPHTIFATPSGKPITSAPAISNGKVYFGSDDGILYILGDGKQTATSTPITNVSQRKSSVIPVNNRYGWHSAFGGPHNTSYVNDSAMKPPIQLKWAMKSFGFFKHPIIAMNDDFVYVSLSGFVVCREQKTGRIRWRTKLAGQGWSRASLAYEDGKLFIPRVGSPRYSHVLNQPDRLYCLDQETGKLLWQNDLGRSDRLRASPVYQDGIVAYGSYYEIPMQKEFIITPGDVWKYKQTASMAKEWINPKFYDLDWKQGIVQADTDLKKTWLLNKNDDVAPLYLRKEIILPQIDDRHELAIAIGFYDHITVYIDSEKVLENTYDWGEYQYGGHAAKYIPLRIASGLLRPGKHTITVKAEKAKLLSGYSSNTFAFPPWLMIAPKEHIKGAIVQAWDANTGEPAWTIPINAGGDFIDGPSGCADAGTMYFTGGGTAEGSKGETIAINPKTGDVLWRNTEAYNCRTGTPAIQGDKLILPGVLKLPIACLSIKDGSIVWMNEIGRQHTFVHAPSISPNFFTLNNKYVGGAKRYDLTTGDIVLHDGEPIELAGRGHGCGTVVLLSEGYSLATTNEGIYLSNVDTGEVVFKTPGFASQTCPHPAFANGRIYYAPQNTGMLYCFEPVSE